MRTTTVMVSLMLSAAALPATAAGGGGDRLFAGGAVGLGFGVVDFVEVSPMLGINLTEHVATGVQLTYRYRNDDRYYPSLTTNDYGGSLFARYRVPGMPFFLQAEYEYLSYEFLRLDGTQDRDTFDSVLGGGGYMQPLAPNTAMYVAALYNFSYDSNDLYRPYTDPWVFRVGIAVAF